MISKYPESKIIDYETFKLLQGKKFDRKIREKTITSVQAIEYRIFCDQEQVDSWIKRGIRRTYSRDKSKVYFDKFELLFDVFGYKRKTIDTDFILNNSEKE